MRTIPAQTTSTLTATEAGILGLLAGVRERSGYDLQKAVERSVGYFWAPARSQMYAILPRLVDAGLVKRRDLRQRQRPDKQLYRITRAGRAALKHWLDEAPLEPEPSRSTLLLKVFFGHDADPEALIRQVREHRARAEQLKRELREIDARCAGSEQDFFPALTRSYGHAYADAVIRWARDAERQLRERTA